LAVGIDGEAWGWGLNSSKQIIENEERIIYSPVRVLDDVRSVAASEASSYFLRRDFTLWSQGNNVFGQLGYGQSSVEQYTPQRVKLPPVGTASNLVLQVDRSVMWSMGEIIPVDPGRETAPRLINNLTMLPIRAVIETFGGSVHFVSERQSTVIYLNGHVLEIRTNSTAAILNGFNIEIVAPIVRNDRTLVHIRILERLGLHVQWDSFDESVTVTMLQ
jgi:hypothetical protein